MTTNYYPSMKKSQSNITGDRVQNAISFNPKKFQRAMIYMLKFKN